MISVQEAVEQADWLVRYARDRIGGDGRHYDSRLAGRLSCATAQLSPAVTLSQPEYDQAPES